MKNEAKYKIGDYVYFIDKKHGIRGGKIISSKVKHEGWYDETIMYTIKGYNNNFEEEELFTSKSKVFREMCLLLDVDYKKLEYVCQFLFPDEVTEADFNTVAPEPLQIPEKTGFFKNFLSTLEYSKEDIQLGYIHGGKCLDLFIICPVCHRKTIVRIKSLT